jgi:hypothetical protein
MRRPLALVVAVCALATAGLAPAARAESVRQPGLSTPLGNELLSNEHTITRWARALVTSGVRTQPRLHSHVFARLHRWTEDGLPEVYVVLRSQIDPASGWTWLKIRVPMRPNGREGWVPATVLGPLRLVTTRLIINRTTLHATLYRSGRVIWRSPVGVGKSSTPTPGGSFYIRERLRVSQPGTIYGPWAFGTSAYSVLTDWPGGGVVGIHGTNEPQLIPGRPSHGCVRVPNAAVSRLAHLMPVGTPVRII